MIFITSSVIGLVASRFRSASVFAFIAFLIPCIFMTAFIASSVMPSFINLGFSVLGYNAGIMATICIALLGRQNAKPKTA